MSGRRTAAGRWRGARTRGATGSSATGDTALATTLRWARSPVAPNSTSMDGSGTRSSRRPSRRTFVGGFARDARLPWRASRSSRIVRGASLGRGDGWAGIGWSVAASTGGAPSDDAADFATSAAGFVPAFRARLPAIYPVLTAWPPGSSGRRRRGAPPRTSVRPGLDDVMPDIIPSSPRDHRIRSATPQGPWPRTNRPGGIGTGSAARA